jgi:hypothetical protein
MTTPGRTHISWQTENGHIRELISYINFLEAKLSYLQYHHERCDTWATSPTPVGANLQYLPPDLIATNDDASDEADNKSHNPQVISSPTATSYVSLTTARPSVKSVKCSPRWRQIIDQMTKGWDKPGSWIEKREVIGLDSIEQNRYALAAILGLEKDFSPFTTDESPSYSSRACSGADTLVTLARQYALGSKACYGITPLDVQVHIFRELVFASLCVVMEHQGLPIDAIEGLMRICLSSSGSANLYRLRRGALWINRVISGTMMKKMGWGHGSTEFFLLCASPSRNR